MASDAEPVFPGLSPDDVLTLYFTRPTNEPDVSTTSKVLALLAFSPPLASVYRASWQSGGDEEDPDAAARLVIVLAGVVNSNITATLVSQVRVSVPPGGGLKDAELVSSPANIVGAGVAGTWGDASQPQFLATDPVVALDYGGQPGLGVGDALVLRFNQPVRQVNVSSRAAIDALLVFEPRTWADDYVAAWLDFTTLLVTVTALSPGVGALADTAVGTLRVSVQPSGGLTSFDGTALPSNATSVVTSGSWGELVCDARLVVYSRTTLVVAFYPPPNASYVPSTYLLSVVSTASGAPVGGPIVVTPAQSAAGVSLPPTLYGSAAPSTLRYLIPSLTPGTGYSGRVGVAPPVLSAEVQSVLPRAVPVVYTWVGQQPACSCAALRSGAGAGCAGAQVATGVDPVTPTPPSIGECQRRLFHVSCLVLYGCDLL